MSALKKKKRKTQWKWFVLTFRAGHMLMWNLTFVAFVMVMSCSADITDQFLPFFFVSALTAKIWSEFTGSLYHNWFFIQETNEITVNSVTFIIINLLIKID